jgi:hypothetical protein
MVYAHWQGPFRVTILNVKRWACDDFMMGHDGTLNVTFLINCDAIEAS